MVSRGLWVMNKEIYNQISSKWKKKRYQKSTGKKQKYTLSQIHLFQGKTVVDIGCNAGIVSYDILKYANKVIGVEYDEYYYNQALVTQKFVTKPLELINCSMRNFLIDCDCRYNAAFASCVLYHLSTEEIDLINDIMIPKCDIVVFVSREDKKKKMNNPYDLQYWVNIEKMLNKHNMSVEVVNKECNWVSVVGRKT